MNDLISIVLPVYNGSQYLRESIESVLAQTYPHWELLIVDDCSKDSTPDIAEEYVHRDSRIRYYRNEQNLRLPRNLNKGFSLTKGDYLTWTSDDNRYYPTALERMHSALKNNPSAQFVFASCRIIDDKGNPVEQAAVTQESISQIVGSNPVGACFMYTRKAYEVVGDYDPEMILVEDFDYWQRICMRFDFTVIEDTLYDYRRHAGALTNTMRRDQFNTNLEQMLLKNISGFGKLNRLKQYYTCRRNLGDKKNPYQAKYKLLQFWYYWFHQIPAGLKRRLVIRKENNV